MSSVGSVGLTCWGPIIGHRHVDPCHRPWTRNQRRHGRSLQQVRRLRRHRCLRCGDICGAGNGASPQAVLGHPWYATKKCESIAPNSLIPFYLLPDLFGSWSSLPNQSKGITYLPGVAGAKKREVKWRLRKLTPWPMLCSKHQEATASTDRMYGNNERQTLLPSLSFRSGLGTLSNQHDPCWPYLWVAHHGEIVVERGHVDGNCLKGGRIRIPYTWGHHKGLFM